MHGILHYQGEDFRKGVGHMNPEVFCTGKRAFRSYNGASKAASKTAHRAGAHYHPYRCTKCGLFHYGQADGRVPKQQARRPRQLNFEDEV